MGWNPCCKIKRYITFFEEINLTRKENVLGNPKSTRKKKYKEHLQKLILNIAETMNDFLPDLFSFFIDQGKQQVKTQQQHHFAYIWNKSR